MNIHEMGIKKVQDAIMNFAVNEAETRTVYNLLVGLVAPRPIALVTSMNESGEINAAPFSSYNYLCSDPPILGIGMMNKPGPGINLKQTRRNIRSGGEFVVNVVTEDLSQQMNICSMEFPEGVSKLGTAGLETVASAVVKVPRLKQAHAALECVEYMTLEIGRGGIVLGRVVSIYVEDRFVDTTGRHVLAEELHAIGRMNGLGAYVKTEGAFLTIPRIPYSEWVKGNEK
jgi:flavin reductase (DIM6/NTAB) family NADH-FMN oxidoreductase RutF